MKNASINLVPLATRRSLELRQIAKRWFAVLCLTVIGCSFAGAYCEHRLAEQRSKNNALAAKCEPTELLMHEAKTLATEVEQVTKLHQTLNNLLPTDDLLQTMGAISQATTFNNPAASSDQPLPKLRRLKISLLDARLPNSTPSKSLSEITSAHVSFSIVGENDQQLQDCVERLRAHPRFQEIQIRSSNQESTSEQRQMEVEALVFVSKEVPR
jgi:hypothetical protein